MDLKPSIPLVRCTRNAILLVAHLLSAFGPSRGRRIITFLGGAATIGPGYIAPTELPKAVRCHRDLEERTAPLFDKAKLFYKELAELLVRNECPLDVFACARGEVGLDELKVAIERTGGLVVPLESFCHGPFSASIHRAFQYNNGGVRSSINKVMDPETIQALLEAADLFSTGMRAFQSEYNTRYTPEEFEDYLLKCAGETADSNLQLACAEVFKMWINMMKAESATFQVNNEIIPLSRSSLFEICMLHPPAYAIHPNVDHRMYPILGSEVQPKQFLEYEDDSGDESA